MKTTNSFYDTLADSYHLLFEDWNRSIEKQSSFFAPLLEQYTGRVAPYVLDCACGIGTQTLGLAQRGHTVVASDTSAPSVARAETEALQRNLNVQFHIADMRDLSIIEENSFDAVLAADNALPHLLGRTNLSRALIEIYGKLRPGGAFVATIRNYDLLIQTPPVIQPPTFYGARGQRRIVHQVWDWEGKEYDVHLYLSLEDSPQWIVKHYLSRYEALLRNDLNASLKNAGFSTIHWLEPSDISFYQPVVIATK